MIEAPWKVFYYKINVKSKNLNAQQHNLFLQALMKVEIN